MKLNKSLWENQQIICLTFDVDWASEDAIKYTYGIIDRYSFKTTFFLTHKSTFIENLIKNNYIDAGIHPNFLAGSSQGKNMKDILEYCLKLHPDAISFRCHKYFENNDITELLYNEGFKYDSNLCTNLELVDPFIHRSGLIRFPIYFEDGAYLLHNNNLKFKDVKDNLFNRNGLYIVNIHPMHLAINTPDFSYMRKIKNSVSKKAWNNLTFNELEHLSYNGRGIRTFILELFDFIKKENLPVLNLKEVYESIIN